MTKTFEQWYEELKDLARKRNLLWLISSDPKDHEESYKDGNSPEEELDEQGYAAM